MSKHYIPIPLTQAIKDYSDQELIEIIQVLLLVKTENGKILQGSQV